MTPHTKPIAVSTVDGLFRELTGAPWPPKNVPEWMFVNEQGLRHAQAGKVFYDPPGQLAERKQAFAEAYYPEDVRLWRVASRLYKLWHYGEYNVCNRLAGRNDGVAALIGQSHFVEAAMQLAFLFNRRFAPYWKWLHWASVRLPRIADKLGPMLDELESSPELPSRARRIRSICEFYRSVLCDQGIFPNKGYRNFMGSFEIVDSKIQDPEVKGIVEDYFGRYKHL